MFKPPDLRLLHRPSRSARGASRADEAPPVEEPHDARRHAAPAATSAMSALVRSARLGASHALHSRSLPVAVWIGLALLGLVAPRPLHTLHLALVAGLLPVHGLVWGLAGSGRAASFWVVNGGWPGARSAGTMLVDLVVMVGMAGLIQAVCPEPQGWPRLMLAAGVVLYALAGVVRQSAGTVTGRVLHLLGMLVSMLLVLVVVTVILGWAPPVLAAQGLVGLTVVAALVARAALARVRPESAGGRGPVRLTWLACVLGAAVPGLALPLAGPPEASSLDPTRTVLVSDMGMVASSLYAKDEDGAWVRLPLRGWFDSLTAHPSGAIAWSGAQAAQWWGLGPQPLVWQSGLRTPSGAVRRCAELDHVAWSWFQEDGEAVVLASHDAELWRLDAEGCRRVEAPPPGLPAELQAAVDLRGADIQPTDDWRVVRENGAPEAIVSESVVRLGL